MVKFENFSRNGDILTADTYVCVVDNYEHVKGVYDMRTENLTVTPSDTSGFVYRQCKKAFACVSYNIKRGKGKKYKDSFVIAWG